MISGIILAAGAGSRMGRQKLLLELGGKPVLQWVLEAALSSRLDEVICVARDLTQVRQRIFLEHGKLRWVTNDRAPEGQSTSVIAGLKTVSLQSEAALFLLGDQPMVPRDLIDSLMDLYRKSSALIVAPTFDGQTRNPVLFHRKLFPDLLQLTGDKGGRDLIAKYKENAAFLEWPNEAAFRDLDTWEEYEDLYRLLKNKKKSRRFC